MFFLICDFFCFLKSGESESRLIFGSCCLGDWVFFYAGIAMSDSEEHHFESKADAGASKTYPQQAGTVRKNGFLVIKGRPCKVYACLDLGSA